MIKLTDSVITPGLRVTHLKTGNEYEVMGKAINCTNAQDNQIMVIYRRLDDPQEFCREISEFCEKFALSC